MSEQPPLDPETEKLLQQLQSKDGFEKMSAAQALGRRGVKDARVVEALTAVATGDPSKTVREAASGALVNLGEPLPASAPAPSRLGGNYTSNYQRALEFATGLSGWFLINGVLWAWGLDGKSLNYGYSIIFNVLFLPLNLIVLLLLALFRRWLAFGILSALALNLLVALVLGLTTNALCGIPFFVK